MPKRAFKEFDMKPCRMEQFARDFLDKHGVPQYWDLALSESVLEVADG